MKSTLINKLVRLSRISKQMIMIAVDSIMIVLVLLSSFSIRLGIFYWPEERLFWIIFGAPIAAIPVFVSFRMYQSVVRYIGVRALISILQAVTLYAVIWGLLAYMARIPISDIPRSVILINWMLTLIVFGGSRIIARWVFTDQNTSNDKSKRNVIIYGAGSAGRQLSHALQLSKEYKHVAYIDDKSGQKGTYINNIPIFPYSKIQSIVEKEDISEVLVALPSISRKKRYEIIDKLSILPVQVRSLPSVSELAEGKVRIDDLLEIDIRDLLGRNITKPNENLLKTNIEDKVVLITGAGGSIGSELCRQVLLLRPKKIVLYEISEPSLYEIEQELIKLNTTMIDIFPVLGSISDKERLINIFNYYGVQTIYHAAAYKHVPLVEFNQAEGVLNNSIGTMFAAEAAIIANVEIFVLISTDKAVRPTNVMGASKRIAELVLQALAAQSNNTCFTMVRFGNVLDSSGSVIPLFRKQIKEGGPLTVTDINVVRYFMTIPEAVQLVIQAGAMGMGGDVFVLDMGQPIKINDLALKMIQLSGLQVLDKNNPEGDIEIQYTGLRPGEKLYEELLVGDNVSNTENKMIMRASEEMIVWDKLRPILDQLRVALIENKSVKIAELLKQLVPEYNSNSKI